MENKNLTVGLIDIQKLFSERHKALEFPDHREEELWDDFLEWYVSDLEERWRRKIDFFLKEGTGGDKEETKNANGNARN